MNNIQLFEDKKIRSRYDEESEKWFFQWWCSGILAESVDATAY